MLRLASACSLRTRSLSRSMRRPATIDGRAAIGSRSNSGCRLPSTASVASICTTLPSVHAMGMNGLLSAHRSQRMSPSWSWCSGSSWCSRPGAPAT